MPSGIHVVRIDRRTGQREGRRAYCRPVYAEVFLAGTEPTATCSVFDHQRKRLPHSFQQFELDERGGLVVPAGELDRLLSSEPGLRLTDGGRRLEFHGPAETIGMALTIVDGGELDPRADPRLEEFEVGEWIGKDGRPARVQWMGRTESGLRARR